MSFDQSTRRPNTRPNFNPNPNFNRNRDRNRQRKKYGDERFAGERSYHSRGNNSHYNNRRSFNPKNAFLRKTHSSNYKMENSNYNIDKNYMKKRLLDYIYQNVEVSKYRYKMIEFEDDMQELRQKKYFVSANYSAPNQLLIFIKLRDDYYSFFVDRRTLRYRREQIMEDKVRLYPADIRVDEEVYKGTIMDGVMISNRQLNTQTYIINDIYMLKGSSLVSDKITNKIINLNMLVNYCIKGGDRTFGRNPIQFRVNKLYKHSEIKKLAHDEVKKMEFNQFIKGIAFYPEYSGTKIIYLFNNDSLPNRTQSMKMDRSSYNSRTSTPSRDRNQKKEDKDEVEDEDSYNSGEEEYDGSDDEVMSSKKDSESSSIKKKVLDSLGKRKTSRSSNRSNKNNSRGHDGKEFIGIITNPKEAEGMNRNITAVFEMRNTGIPDVYNLYLSKKSKKRDEDGNKIVKTKKYDIAYIPTKDCSKFCKSLFKDTANDLNNDNTNPEGVSGILGGGMGEGEGVKVKCQFDDLKQKWIPLKKVKQSKKLDRISKVKKLIE